MKQTKRIIGLIPPIILTGSAGNIGASLPFIKEIQAGMSVGILKESFINPKFNYPKRRYTKHLRIKKTNWLNNFMKGGY